MQDLTSLNFIISLHYKPDEAFKKLEVYCNPSKNQVIESHRLWDVTMEEPFGNFLTELRRRADCCKFKENDKMICDNFVLLAKGTLQQLLLREDDLSLEKLYKYVVSMSK